MAQFARAIATVLKHEGGFVDNPSDPGGATKWGVSLRYLRMLGDSDGDGQLDGDLDHDGDVDALDVRNLTKSQATEIYRANWWNRFKYARISSQMIATKVFDLSVNMGPNRAHRLLQQSLCCVDHKVEIDGQIGPKTLEAILAAGYDDGALWHREGKIEDIRVPGLLAALRSEAAGFYRTLVAAVPRREEFLRGWLKRAYS